MGLALPPDLLDRDLVLDFFWKFSVYECALKRSRFLKRGRAEADWDKFARVLQGRFATVSHPGFQDAVTQLNRLSPKRQVVRDAHLHWEPIVRRDHDSDEQFTLRLLRTARNNLFHGGKYPDGQVEQIVRDQDILKAACTVLDGCYEVHAGMKEEIDRVLADLRD